MMNQLPPGLLDAVIWQESRGNPNAVSPAGAMGLMQVMPDTARQPGFGLKPLNKPFDPVANKEFGTAYLGKMLDRYKGDIPKSLAAYNWGPGNADKWGGNMANLPSETRNYIKNITQRMGSPVTAQNAPNQEVAPMQRRNPQIAPAGARMPRNQASGGIMDRLSSGFGDFEQKDLLNLGAGLLAGNTWQEGLGYGMQGLAQARDKRGATREAEARRDQMLATAQNLTPEQQAALAAMPPEQAAQVLAQQAFKEPAKRGVVRGADGYNYFEDTGERVLPGVEQPAKDTRTTGMKEYETAVAQGYKGSLMDFKTELKKAGAANTNVNVAAQETSYGKEMGKEFAKANMAIATSAQKSRTSVANLNRLEQALADPNVYQGAGGQTVQRLKSIGKALGFEVEGASSGEVAQSISNQIALQLRDPSTGAGMPGAMSDADRAFLQNMVANLDKTPEGNKMVIDAMRKVYERNVEIDKLRRRYVKKTGRLDDGFYDELAEFSEANPLFQEQAPTANTPEVGAVDDGYIFKGGDPSNPDNWELAQ